MIPMFVYLPQDKKVCYDSDVEETAKSWAKHLGNAKPEESLSSPKR